MKNTSTLTLTMLNPLINSVVNFEQKFHNITSYTYKNPLQSCLILLSNLVPTLLLLLLLLQSVVSNAMQIKLNSR